MTDAQKDEIVALAFAYMQTRRSRDKNPESISRQRVLLFMALDRAEATDESRRAAEEVAGPRDDGGRSQSNAVSG
jgi:hypothetical protein